MLKVDKTVYRRLTIVMEKQMKYVFSCIISLIFATVLISCESTQDSLNVKNSADIIPKKAQQEILDLLSTKATETKYAVIYTSKDVMNSNAGKIPMLAGEISTSVKKVIDFIEPYTLKNKAPLNVLIVPDFTKLEGLTYTAAYRNQKYMIVGGKDIDNLSYIEAVAMAVTKDQRALWLKVGHGLFLKDYFGENFKFANYVDNLDKMSSRIVTNLPSFSGRMSRFIGMNIPEINTDEEWQVYYILSGSFVKYLYNKLGKDDFYKMYESSNPAEFIKITTGSELNDLKENWLLLVKTY